MHSIAISERSGVRYLHFGSRWIQGAMRLSRPNALELEYTRAMLIALLLRATPNWPRSVLSVGLGAASLPRFLYRHRPHAAQTVVEIDPAVVAVARQSFALPPESARLRVVVADAADFVAGGDRRFDLILVDGFDGLGHAGVLETLPFYCNCLARLSDTGILAANHLSGGYGSRQAIERLKAAFGGRARALPACDSGNVIALAAAGGPVDLPWRDLRKAAQRLRADTHLSLLPLAAKLEAQMRTNAFTL